jgi:hypothetical protein
MKRVFIVLATLLSAGACLAGADREDSPAALATVASYAR